MDPRLTLPEVIAHAQRVEALGYDGLHVAETIHDALALALLAIEHTEHLLVRTSVALAFTRSPTLTAYAAWDLSKLSGGRFELGLGTQIRQNIEDRYGMSFSQDPLGQLRDYVGAVRAAFAGKSSQPRWTPTPATRARSTRSSTSTSAPSSRPIRAHASTEGSSSRSAIDFSRICTQRMPTEKSRRAIAA